MFVLDASVAAVWAFEDEHSRQAEKVLEMLQQSTALVPPIWPLEVANLLLVGERRGRLTSDQAAKALSLLAGLSIAIDQGTSVVTLPELLQLARAHRLSAYDASYLELAKREQLPLATLDERLSTAARAAGVRLLA